MKKIFDALVKVFVEQLANKNQFVITYNKPNSSYRVYSFQSYNSLIAIYDTETQKLYINWYKWDYSKTTMKHLKMFINDWTRFRYETKSQFTKEIATNPTIETFTN